MFSPDFDKSVLKKVAAAAVVPFVVAVAAQRRLSSPAASTRRSCLAKRREPNASLPVIVEASVSASEESRSSCPEKYTTISL
jgi:hypothetical protein